MLSFYRPDLVIFPDISVVLHHFDTNVIQFAYEPYHGFNFGYLFVTSVCLICTCHLVNIIYWAMRRRVNPKVIVKQLFLLKHDFFRS